MDTQTVLKIIKMLDARIIDCEDFLNDGQCDYDQLPYVSGELRALEELREHLQKYIDK